MDAELLLEPEVPRIGHPVTITLSMMEGELPGGSSLRWSMFVRDGVDEVHLPQYENQTVIRIESWDPEHHGTYYVDLVDGASERRLVAQTVPSSIRISLSGGGFRASLLSLGALLYLVESGQNYRIEDVASVSGGSITNAFVAARCDITSVTRDEFLGLAGDFCTQVTRRHLLPRVRVPEWLLASSWLAPRVLVVGGALWAVGFLTDGLASWLWFGVVVLVLILALTLRGFVVESMLRRRFGLDDSLGQPRRRVTHAYCATDLVVGEPLYFLSTNAGGFVYARSRGAARFDALPVRKAVRSSAAFPGAFLPKRVRLPHARFEWGSDPFQPRARHEGSVAYCADGGVANNLATQWHEENVPNDWPYRLIYGSELCGETTWRPGREILQVAIDATQELKPASSWSFAVPGLAEAKALLRVMSVMYSNTVVPRRAAASWERSKLVERALRTVDEGWSYFPMQRGAHRLVIVRPTDEPDAQLESLQYSMSTVYGRPMSLSVRAILTRADLAALLTDEAIARADQMPTTLFRRSRLEVQDALFAGYIGALAVLNTYEDLGVPESRGPTIERIRHLL